MPFQEGHKFGKGNKGAQLIEAALRRAILADDGKRLRTGVEALYTLFATGDLAAFTMGNSYDQKDAAGFIRILGLPARSRAAALAKSVAVTMPKVEVAQ